MNQCRGHYSGSSPLLLALWEICDWAQWRSVHSVKCTYVCGGRLLSLAAGSHYVELHWGSWACVLCAFSPLFSACCDSVWDNLGKICGEHSVQSWCTWWLHVVICLQLCTRVSVCVSVFFVCIFQRVSLKESDSGAWENVSTVCLLNWGSPLTLCWSCRH